MPRLSVTPAAEINCLVDGFTDPWAEPETVLLVHGLAESSAVWWAWMPHLARRLRVARIDQRGFGKSTPMPEDFKWSVDVLADDIGQVIREVAPKGVHLVGAKIAGPVVIRAARRHPELIKTLSLIGVPVQGPKEAEWLATVEKEGVRAWAAATMDARLAGMSREMKDWWIDLMAATPRSTMLGFLRFVSSGSVARSWSSPPIARAARWRAWPNGRKKSPIRALSRWPGTGTTRRRPSPTLAPERLRPSSRTRAGSGAAKMPAGAILALL